MSIRLTEEERGLFVTSVRRMLAESWPAEHAVERSRDPAAQRLLLEKAIEQGLAELGSPDGPGLREALMVFEELGRASCPVPLSSVYVVNHLLADAGDEAVKQFVSDVREGVAYPALVLGDLDGDRNAGRLSMRDGRITGSAAFAEGAAVATHLLMFSSNPAGVAVVDRDQAGVKVEPAPTLGISELSRIEVDAPVTAWLPLPLEELVEAALIARLAATARSLGAAQRSFELALEHAKQRQQFGHVIGEFQAIQHKLADCLIWLDGSRLSLAGAADAADGGDRNWRYFAEAAIAYAGPWLRQLILEAHHVMGAIGYAEEHELPRHFRAIHADVIRFGGAARARKALANYLLDLERQTEPGSSNLPSHDTDAGVTEFRNRIRAWLAENWTDADRAENRKRPFKDRAFHPEMSRKMGAAGWTGLDWPKDVGGLARSPGEQLAFIEELEFAEVPTDAHMGAETIIGPAIIRHGTEAQKRDFLPAFLRGERSFALHYSEPQAGSDLASLRTTARRDGDEWVINGQKLWTTGGDKAEYAFLAARTDTEAKPKHAGISIFLVPLNTPGITIRSGMFMYGRTFCETFYDEVRLPGDALLGAENGGWKVITDALAAERVMIGTTVAHLQHLFDRVVDYLRSCSDDPDSVRLDPVIRDRVGLLASEIEVARQFVLRNGNLVQAGRVPIYEAAMSKVFVGELQERLGEAAMDILGSAGLLTEDAASAPIPETEQVLRHSLMGVLGGGTSEMQRNTIALRGLGLPRYSR